jgi:hypothetical protein
MARKAAAEGTRSFAMSSPQALKARLPEPEAQGPDWKQITLSVSPELGESLDEMTRGEQKSLSDILVRAISLYRFLSQAHQEGKRVGVAAEGDGLETEITGF